MFSLNLGILCIVFLLPLCCSDAKTNSKNAVLETILDFKDFKKLLRTKTNVLIMFVSNTKQIQAEYKLFREAAAAVKGIGTMVLIDCSTQQERKKLCKKLKVTPAPYALKHYKDGDFHKDYERQLSVSSMVNFMRDPAGDLPWAEDPAGTDVLHFSDHATFLRTLKRAETRRMLVMFYVPWCGYCKRLKPEYAKAAAELKEKEDSGYYLLAAMDVERAENAPARRAYNITGFPTLLYFESGQLRQTYDGDTNKDALIAFILNPSLATSRKSEKETDDDWSSDTNSEVVHLTTQGFEPAIKDEASVLIMFYAPWCGHCQRMKPEYERAAVMLKAEPATTGMLAALDATKETAIAERFKVKGFPTLKYFINGEFKFDVNLREANKIVEFMRKPEQPPPPPPPEQAWEDEEGRDAAVLFLTEENFGATLKRKKHALVLFYAPWCGHCKNVKPEFWGAAVALKDDTRIIFAAIDCTRQTTICQLHEVRAYPTIKYFSYLKTAFVYNGGRKREDFIKFMHEPRPTGAEGVVATESKVVEPFGTFAGAEHILMLSDNNFEPQLQKYERLLVLFYAPWCGHCRDLKPAYAAAAVKLTAGGIAANDTNATAYRLAALDCSFYKISAKKYNIEAFPTLLLFERGMRKATYNGKRTAEDILAFLLGDKVKADAEVGGAHDEL